MDSPVSAQAPSPQTPQVADPILPTSPPATASTDSTQSAAPSAQPTVAVQPPSSVPLMDAQGSVSTQTTAVDTAALQSIATAPQVQSAVGTKNKEVGPLSSEVAGFVEVAGTDAFEQEPMPVEVASFMEKVSRGENGGTLSDVAITPPDSTDASNTSDSRPVYVLPLGKAQVSSGLHQSVNTSIRWLAEWCTRMLRKLGNDAEYQV